MHSTRSCRKIQACQLGGWDKGKTLNNKNRLKRHPKAPAPNAGSRCRYLVQKGANVNQAASRSWKPFWVSMVQVPVCTDVEALYVVLGSSICTSSPGSDMTGQTFVPFSCAQKLSRVFPRGMGLGSGFKGLGLCRSLESVTSKRYMRVFPFVDSHTSVRWFVCPSVRLFV